MIASLNIDKQFADILERPPKLALVFIILN